MVQKFNQMKLKEKKRRVSTDNSLFGSHEKCTFNTDKLQITDLWSSLFIWNAQDIAMTPFGHLFFFLWMCQLKLGCRWLLFLAHNGLLFECLGKKKSNLLPHTYTHPNRGCTTWLPQKELHPMFFIQLKLTEQIVSILLDLIWTNKWPNVYSTRNLTIIQWEEYKIFARLIPN